MLDGFEIAMNDPLLMQRGERAEDGQRDLDGVASRQRSPARRSFSGSPSRSSMARNSPLSILVDLVQLADVWMIDARGGARLAPEALPLLAAGMARPDSS